MRQNRDEEETRQRESVEKVAPYDMSIATQYVETLAKEVWDSLDTDGSGFLEPEEFRVAVRRLGLTMSRSDEVSLLTSMRGNDGVGSVGWPQFLAFAHRKHEYMLRVFRKLDRDGDGSLSRDELLVALQEMGLAVEPSTVSKMIRRMDTSHDGRISFDEFRTVAVLFPDVDDFRTTMLFWQTSVDGVDLGETSCTKPPQSSASMSTVIASGALAGTLSRTLTAPFDRLKVLLQAGASLNGVKVTGILQGMRAIYAENGLRSFFRGNWVNCVKIAPESSVRMFAFDRIRKGVMSDSDSTLGNFAVGAATGVLSQLSIYPMEVIKTRISVAPTVYKNGILDCFTQIYRHEGAAALYRGVVPSVAGVIPYAGVDLGLYHTLRGVYLAKSGQRDTKPPAYVVLSIAALSSLAGQTVSYPFQLIRTRLQSQGVNGQPRLYTGVVDCLRKTVAADGPSGLFKGITTNFLKAVPASAISFLAYEKSMAFFSSSAPK